MEQRDTADDFSVWCFLIVCFFFCGGNRDFALGFELFFGF